MRKNVIRLVLMTMLIAGVSSVCRATGPLPPMIPSYGCEIIYR